MQWEMRMMETYDREVGGWRARQWEVKDAGE